MSLRAGRVGVAPTEVDSNGKLKGGSSDSYTKQQSDNRFAKKTSLGGLEFREEDGVAQYKTPSGEWVNFSSGGTSLKSVFDASNVSPEITDRTCIALRTKPNCAKVGVFSDTDRTELIGYAECLGGTCLLYNMPVDVFVYIREYDAEGKGVAYSAQSVSSGLVEVDAMVKGFKAFPSAVNALGFAFAS